MLEKSKAASGLPFFFSALAWRINPLSWALNPNSTEKHSAF
jgi:hypothetical protein